MGPIPFICSLFQAVTLHKFILRIFRTYVIRNLTSDPCKVFLLFLLHLTWNLPCACLRHPSGLSISANELWNVIYVKTLVENDYMHAWSPSLLLWYSSLPISKNVPKSCRQIVSLLWWCAAMLSTFELSAFPFSSLIINLKIKIFAVSL